MEHLQCFKALKVVSLGEDSTSVVSRVQCDSETNKLVGFVLPCTDNELPICDSFLATSFKAMETSFKEGILAKYTFVYMIQPLNIAVPAFCLACIGTDNNFYAELVIKHWNNIHNQLNQCRVTLVSIGQMVTQGNLGLCRCQHNYCLPLKVLQVFCHVQTIK